MIKRVLIIGVIASLFVILALFILDAVMSYSDEEIREELGDSVRITYEGPFSDPLQ